MGSFFFNFFNLSANIVATAGYNLIGLYRGDFLIIDEKLHHQTCRTYDSTNLVQCRPTKNDVAGQGAINNQEIYFNRSSLRSGSQCQMKGDKPIWVDLFTGEAD